MSDPKSHDLFKMEDATDFPVVTDKPKKRKFVGRVRDIKKKLRISGHTSGEDCNCSRFKCFTNVNERNRSDLLTKFNAFRDKNEQDLFLSTLISTEKVKRRRIRGDECNANLREASYKFFVCVTTDESSSRVQVCKNGFMSIFGIRKTRIENICKSLAKTGVAPKDGRGLHANRPHAFTAEQRDRIKSHISSFRGRKSHYSLKDSKRLYLPEELNVGKMHQMYKEKYPDDKCCYESYRSIFTNNFNISFGYPRQDTCSTCDEINAEIKHLDAKLQTPNSDCELNQLKRDLELKRTIHLRKASVFYERKKRAKVSARSNVKVEAIAFDFQKNLNCPNVTTNDVYYRRQLSFYSFNIHELSTNEVYLFCYDETVAKKGADDICSMLNYFFTKYLDHRVVELQLFCDSCAGQNKNWTVLRFLSYLVHIKKRFKRIQLSFPIRGHSYMECDKDMGPVNLKAPAETPKDWRQELRTARKNPSPYNVIDMKQDMFWGYSSFLKPLFKNTCPIATRPLREVVFEENHLRLMKYRDSWNGSFDTAVMSKPKKKVANNRLQKSYTVPLPISDAKYADLQVLKRFCSHDTKVFFDKLPLAAYYEDTE